MIRTPGPTTSSHHPWHLLPLETMDLDCDCAFVAERAAVSVLSVPVLYSLELTPVCNHQCAGCSNVFAHTAAPTPLTLDGWVTVLDTIAPFAQRVKLTGGEPTCHPQFAEIVAALQHRSLPFTLFSNGSWQHPDETLTLLQHATNCLGILVSLHGADAATHEHFTGVAGSFARVVETIQRATNVGLPIHTNTVISRQSAQQLEAIVKASHELGASCSVFNRYIGAAHPTFDLSTEELQQVAAELRRLSAAGYCTKTGTPLLPTHNYAPFPCLAGSAYCTVDPWGYVRPCNHAPLVAGHIIDDGLERLWQGRPLDAWRAMARGTVCGDGTCVASTGNVACRADMLLRGGA